jgi:hypothetical protein
LYGNEGEQLQVLKSNQKTASKRGGAWCCEEKYEGMQSEVAGNQNSVAR